MQDPFYYAEEDENEGTIFSNLSKYVPHWKWFLACVVISLSISFFMLRYATPEYKAVSKIVVRDEKKGSLNSELGAFADMGLLSGMKSNVDNEVEILNSITLVEKTVQRLKLTTNYFKLGKIRDVELYKASQPFEFGIENASEIFYKTPQTFSIKIISERSFEWSNPENKTATIFNFGATIALKEAKIKIQKLPNFNSVSPIGETYKVYCNPLIAVGKKFGGVLTIEALSKTSSVVNLSISNSVPEKAEDFLNALVAIYNEEAIKDKNIISENTQRFIEKRLEIITNELGDVEGKSENFKKTNKLTDIPTNSQIYLENYSDFEKSLIETETQLRVLAIMIDFMKNKSKSELVPTDIIPNERGGGMQNPLISQYNSLVLQRNRVLKDGTQKNYVLVNLDQQLEGLEKNIKESLAQLKASLQVKRADLEKQDAILLGKINEIPTQEREFRILERQQKIKEGIYLYLIQKREETAIALSVTEANAKIIDAGRADLNPISPKKTIFYLVALLIGLGVPFLILYIIFMLDDKLGSREDVEKYAKNIPILGEIPIIDATDRFIASKKEAFRTVLHNANFITPDNKNEGSVILVTSSKKGEGKTFISYKMATAYAQLDKKTILIGADFRNPQLHKYLNQDKLFANGLSNYLHSSAIHWQDLITTVEAEEHTFDVLLAGSIPPNPTLLLSSKRFETLITELKKKYDIILIDSAPTILVSDTLIISKLADTTLFVNRVGVTEKKLLNYAAKLVEDKKVNNVGFVINGVDFNKSYGYGYNYGYGYGYEAEELQTSWFMKTFLGRRLFNKNKNS